MDSRSQAGFGISARGRRDLAAIIGRGHRVVTVDDAATVLSVDRRTAAKRLARWAEKGWLRRIRRGLYIAVPVDARDPRTWSEDALVVAAAVWPPCYFTGWTAANHWGMSEQVFRTTVLKTTARVRANTVSILGHEYMVIHAAPHLMEWGLKSLWHEELRLQIADPARTVIDILDAPRLAGGIRHVTDIVTAYLEEHDPTQLIIYGDRLGNRAVFKRLGFLLETLVSDQRGLLESCRERLSSGISLLDPDGPRTGPSVASWRIRINATVGRQEPS